MSTRPARVLVFAGIISVAVLYSLGVSPGLLAVQALAVGLATLFAWRPHRLLGRCVVIFGPLLLVTAAAIGDAQLGMQRWLAIGPLRVEVAALVVPPLIAMLHVHPRPANALSVMLSTVALAVQPAPVAATALAVAVVFGRGLRPWAPLAGLCVLGAALAWWWTAPLPPVMHTEGVIAAALAVQPLWAALGVGLIAAVVWAAPHPLLRLVIAIFACAPFIGAWPVPFAGYGASIWIGVGLAYGLSAGGPWPAPRSDRRPGDPPSHGRESPRG